MKAQSKWYTMQDVIDTVGGGLQGTDYVFVSANGTPEENAAELQAAYELAKVKVDLQEKIVPFIPEYFYYFYDSEINIGFLDLPFESYVDYGGSPIESNIIYELIFDEVSYFAYYDGISWLFVNDIYPTGNDYTTLEILVSTITYNVINVIVAPGKYSFTSDFLVDTEYVNIVSLTGNADVLFTGEGTINVTASDILLKGINVQDKPFTIATNLDLLVVEDCVGGQYSFGGDGETNPINVSGTFKNCITGDYSFGYKGVATGIFENCIAGIWSFGADGQATGTFINCVGSGDSFGRSGYASGTFINCKARDTSFSFMGNAIGVFDNCVAGASSFGAGDSSVPGQSVASGTFTNCVSDGYSFGSYQIASGVFTNCIGGEYSFAGPFSGTLSGKLYYCRLTEGVFATVSNAGRTIYCIDGYDNTNNQ